MRQKLLLLVFFTLLTLQISKADFFLFKDSQTGAFVSYSRVQLDDTPVGYTDMYRRINISRPPGQYPCTVIFLGRSFQIRLSFTGDKNLKQVPLSQ